MKKNNTSLYLVALFAVALLIGIGYAALTSVLNINGQTTIGKASWDVHFEDAYAYSSNLVLYSATDTDMSNPLSNITAQDLTTLKYKAKLSAPGDSAYFTVNVVNDGTIDAKISNVTLPAITLNSDDYNVSNGADTFSNLVDVSCTWNDGSTISVNETLNAGESKTIKCNHRYKTGSEISNGDINRWTSISTSEISTDLSLTLDFVQAD